MNTLAFTEEAHLAQSALHLSEKVIIAQVIGVIVNVIDTELQPLHHLEIIVQDELLSKLWIQTVEDHLCAPKLEQDKDTCRLCMYGIYCICIMGNKKDDQRRCKKNTDLTPLGA